MNWFGYTKRFLSLLLCCAMLLGMMPLGVLQAEAAEGKTHYLAFATDRHGNSSVIAKVLSNMETQSGGNIEYVGLGGDMPSNDGSYNTSTLLTEVNNGVAVDLTSTAVDVTKGSHDGKVNDDSGMFHSASGELYAGDEYYVYGIVQADMEAASSTAADAFVTWATKEGMDTSKVIIVLSHLPLHYFRKDNLGATYWDAALNTVADANDDGIVDRDIIFFHGHNHSQDNGTNYQYTVGEGFSLQGTSKNAASVATTNYYTYATAGYLNDNSEASLVTITDTAFTVTRYGTNGTGDQLANVTRVASTTETNPTLDSVVISGTAEYTVGDSLALTVTANYSEGDPVDVTDKVEWTNLPDMTTVGSFEVTATYEGVTSEAFTVTVKEAEVVKTLSSIAVTTMPTKVEYTVGEEFTSEGLVVTATYSDGETAPVEGYTLSEVDMTTAGTKTVTVTYEGLTATFDIAVSETAPTLESITVSGETEYAVGDNGLNLTVTASYDNGTTADVTADSEFTGCDLTASGVYTVTASYGGMTATIDVTVKLYEEVLAADGETLLVAVEAFSQGATALTVTWDEAAELVLDQKAVYSDYYVYKLALENHAEGAEAEYSMTIPEDMDATNLGLYHVAEDGTLTEVPFVIENDCAVFTTTLTGTFALGAISVPAGYTLSELWFENSHPDYFVGESLWMPDVKVIAVYAKDDAEDYTREIGAYEENNNPDGYTVDMDSFDMTAAGTYNVKIDYSGISGTFPIYVWGDTFGTDVTVKVGAGEYGVTDVTVAESANTNVAAAVEGKLNEGYVAYDISMNFAEGYETNEAEKTVTLPIPEGVTNPVVYYVPAEGDAEKMTSTVDGENVTFTTTHFSTYVVGSSIMTGEDEDITVPGTPSTTTEQWVLTDTLTAGQTYLIVDANSGTGHALVKNNGTVSSVEVEVNADNNGNMYIVLDNTAAEWTVGGNYTFANNSKYLGWTDSGSNNYSLALADSANTWTISGNTLSGPTWQTTSSDGCGGTNTTDHTGYLAYSNGWTISETSDNIYYYTKGDVTTGGSESATYSMDITLNGTATQGIDAAFVKENGTLELGTAFTPAQPSGGTYTWTSSNSNVATVDNTGKVTFTGTEGTTLIQVKYTWTVGENTYTISNYTSIKVTGVLYDMVLSQDGKTAAPDTIAQRNVKNGTTLQLYALATMQTDETTTETATPTSTTWYVYMEDDTDASTIATIDQTGKLTFTGEEGTIKVMVACVMGGETYNDIVTINVRQSNAVTPGESTTDFPRWPNPGAVRFDKTAKAVGNFSETGIAQVELSMAGIPVGGKAADVILVLDWTNSMDNKVDGTNSRKVKAAEAARTFLKTLMLDDSGNLSGNRVIIYGFESTSVWHVKLNSTTTTNEFETITADMISGYTGDTTEEKLEAFLAAKITTSTLGSGSNLSNISSGITAAVGSPSTTNSSGSGGTNYGYPLFSVYNKFKNTTYTAGNERSQYCVFMSDGAPTSNYYYGIDTETEGADGSYTYSFGRYNNSTIISWYTNNGTSGIKKELFSTLAKRELGVTFFSVGLGIDKVSGVTGYSGSVSDTQYYDIASTILGNIASPATSQIPNTFFPVTDADAGTGALATAFDNIATSIRAAATNISVEDAVTDEYDVIFELPKTNIEGVPEGQEFYIEVVEYPLDEDTHERTGETKILQRIYLNGNSISKITYTNDAGQEVELEDITPTYSPKAKDTDKAYFDADGNHVPDGSGTHHMTSGAKIVVNEENGKSKITLFTPNFVYDEATKKLNWTVTSMSETSEIALRYFVYLKNSGGYDANEQVDPGTYPTNKYATLNYTNHLGNECEQTFPVPQMTWNGAQVSYVFYLVNEEGKPVNRAGREITFAEAIFVTDVHTFEIVWNDLEQSAGLEAEYLAEKLLPEDYRLYDQAASYNIHVYEDVNKVDLNNHFILAGTDKDTTTYVYNNKTDVNKYNTHGTYAATSTYLCKSYSVTATVDANGTITAATYNKVDGETQVAYADLPSKNADGIVSGAQDIDGYAYYVDEFGKVYTIVQKSDATPISGFDFANTTVAFAVVWEKKLVEDTVVVDFGLPVDIDVVSNDFVYNYINGISATDPNYGINEGYKPKDEGTGYVPMGQEALTIQGHTVAIKDQNNIRFTPGSTVFNEPVKFYYETIVEAYEDSKVVDGYMYSSVTVIPATTVYYEDSFVTFTSVGKAQWSTEGTTTSATQSQDRPGESQISADLDADNVYGYDKVYNECSTYSMGSAKKITVTPGGNYGTAEFEFYGTGFDVISMTSNTTGTIVVRAYAWDDTNKTYNMDKPAASYIVDTYYGYTYDAAIDTDKNGDGMVNDEDRWVLSINTPNSLYQVPVMKVVGLAYGRYKAVITADYLPMFDHNGTGSYDFYLDAIRIYDPAGKSLDDLNDAEKNAYAADGELLPNYYELRNWLISKETFNSAKLDSVNGIVFIDSNDAATVVADYSNYGPNNELYLAPGQAVSFTLNASNETKIPAGYVVDQVHIAYKSVGGTAYAKIYDPAATTMDDAEALTVSTATDLYFNITALNDGNVVIVNAGTTGNAILSITNVKATYKAAENVEQAKTSLRNYLNAVGTLTEANYTEDSWTSYNKALSAANTELENTEATIESVTKVHAELKTAYEALELKDAANEASVANVFTVTAAETGVALMSLRRTVVDDETTEEETTEPTEPEATVPETTEPEVTEPETTVPETTEPEVTEPEATVPETTEPEVTEPENDYQQSMDQIVETAKKVYNFISNLFSRWF